MSSCLGILCRHPPHQAHNVLRLSQINVAVLKSNQLHTTDPLSLRKAPVQRGVMGNLWVYFPWPSYLIKALIRKKFKPEDFGPDEEYRRSMFHRLSYVYALTVWTGIGCLVYFYYQGSIQTNDEKRKAEIERGDFKPLPYQGEIDKGGAMSWVNALKTPEEMQNIQQLKVIKFKGVSYQGEEDVTVAAKELGQEKARRQTVDASLRKRYDIALEKDGGPTNAELRQQFAEMGKDYELELDFANQMFRVKTSYNPDGTVGEVIGSVTI